MSGRRKRARGRHAYDQVSPLDSAVVKATGVGDALRGDQDGRPWRQRRRRRRARWRVSSSLSLYLRLLRTGAGAEDAVCVCGASSEGTDEAEEAVCTVCAAASESAYYRAHRGDPSYRLLLAYWRDALARDEANEAVPKFVLSRGGWVFLVIGTYKHDEALWTRFEPECRGELGHATKSLLPWQMADVAMRADNGDGELLDHMLIMERGESAEDFARRAFQGEEEEDEEEDDSNE